MARADLDFVAGLGRRRGRTEADRFRPFGHADLITRDKINLGIFWLKDDTLDEPDLLPPPDEFTAEIVENLERGARPLPQGRAELTGLMT
jgi:type I restriction enzyme M protein